MKRGYSHLIYVPFFAFLSDELHIISHYSIFVEHTDELYRPPLYHMQIVGTYLIAMNPS